MPAPHPAPERASTKALEDPGATLAAWRTQGAARCDPVGFEVIEALARRAAAHQGAARRAIEARLAQRLQAYADRHGPDWPAPAAAHTRPHPVAPGPLAVLVQQMSGHARRAELPLATEPAALDYFRSTWSQISIQRQITQSLATTPRNAGPLNSHRLVVRALQAMREVSPAYLSRFMAHADALQWLERAAAEPVVPTAGSASRSLQQPAGPGWPGPSAPSPKAKPNQRSRRGGSATKR